MNDYTFKDLQVGHTEEFDIQITEEMVGLFVDITDDRNPLHQDPAFANRNGFDDKVVYGLLTASFISTLAGVYLPGKNSLIHSLHIDFCKPVYVGDSLTIRGEVVDKHESVEQLVIKVEIINAEEMRVLRAKLRVGMLHG